MDDRVNRFRMTGECKRKREGEELSIVPAGRAGTGLPGRAYAVFRRKPPVVSGGDEAGPTPRARRILTRALWSCERLAPEVMPSSREMSPCRYPSRS